ncbi:SDR family oxidoreductase [Metabacillus malikii]|uniref:Uncharacterized protein YbjT (DUF2867 family) n=1 Tax=Metabacillus malikii TaxID=1504265 RepID=A0ABT9ZCM1_9BACI|nr:SDR family oxidoreductase [Metabacillus malikii]MDQ0230021.1 uncharacterized protein YbjT (DUF2867 family) [Metabacillus malikii]
MKVLVVGANGQIGKHLVQLLHSSSEYSVKAMVRTQEQVKELHNSGIDAVMANLEGTVEELVEAVRGCDAIVFTAGSGGHTGADKTLLIDLDGAVKTIEAAERENITRYMMVSALQANNRENWNEQLKPYYVAKHYADKMLIQSSLNYTIIRPGGLINEQGTGHIDVGGNLSRTTIPREDVARTIYACLSNKKTYKQSFDLVAGDKPINEALNQISS